MSFEYIWNKWGSENAKHKINLLNQPESNDRCVTKTTWPLQQLK